MDIAMILNHSHIVNELIKNQFEINTVSLQTNKTPFHIAVEENQIPTKHLLVTKEKLDPTIGFYKGYDPLFLCIYN